MSQQDKHIREKILGIDVGSVAISIVALDPHGRMVSQVYALHHGDVRKCLRELLESYKEDSLLGIASPSGKNRFDSRVKVYDQQVCLMEAASALEPGARSILHVGAERFFLLEMDENGGYYQTSHSSSCAAGTGSFLDQQATRLQLKDTAHLSSMALNNQSPVPEIAARCSVFAKTDLIHAQQKGYGMEAICDSLCKGLAENISDTLFNKSLPAGPVYMSGGVSRNESVVRHLRRITGLEIRVHEHAQHLPAMGAALLLLAEHKKGHKASAPASFELLKEQEKLDYFYEPLRAPSEVESEVHRLDQYRFSPAQADHTVDVQVERYQVRSRDDSAFFLGMDIGSTSTKAVLLTSEGEPWAGFYTYTSGQPLKAVQALFEAMDHLSRRVQNVYDIRACATTGSGRKFIAGIVGADQDVDEITAHARAAYALNPGIDTIIEIGGQDAKFTQMRDGVVSFSHMNTVCAAGTGSFIEELAGRLGVALEDYEKLAMGRAAPLASDRCTVFMERDINQLLSQGYSKEEVLATVIHSVRENYLKKVAGEARIGEQVCFQGATARNRALVAAFEQRLGKPVYVSPLCHLTGALGAALLLKEEFRGDSSFKGLDLYKRQVPVHTEVCELCLNHCSISVAHVNGHQEAYGFLCGRDYDTKKFVRKELRALELLAERRKVQRDRGERSRKVQADRVQVGLPATLHLVEDLPYWKAFFRDLGIPLLTSENFKDSLKTGKKIAGAEFCAPVDSMYGHVAHIARHCEHIFMPVYLEARNKARGREENFCYYTQFAASMASMEGSRVREKLVSPMLDFGKNADHNARILLDCLKDMGQGSIKLSEVSRAMKKASNDMDRYRKNLERIFRKRFNADEGVSVLLLGRPYVVLSNTLNKGIPDIFTGMGVDAFYQDMISLDKEADPSLEKLLEKTPWHFAAQILRAAEQAARTPGLYPVLITAFKCAPDSFIMGYFKQLMQLYDKPFLVIQIDEHESNTGYETRIEAALRSFRNHRQHNGSVAEADLDKMVPEVENKARGKSLLIPNWDTFVSPLVAANLRRVGYDAHVLEPSELGIRKSMVHNTGQCLPINIIAQNSIDYMERHGLDPANTLLWMMEGHISCNLRQYPSYIKQIFESHGKGMEKAGVYSGKITHREMSVNLTYYAYFAYMLGGLFRKTACRIRPYERQRGRTDEVFREVHRILLGAFEGKQSLDRAIKEGVALVDTIDYDTSYRKPMVAIFGDLYVRDNDIMNQDLVGDIERAGGEALITPYHDYTKLIIENIFRRAIKRGEHVETLFNRMILNVLKIMDDRYYRSFSKYLGPAPAIRVKSLENKLKEFNIDLLHAGESYDNILKIFYIVENYPEVALFVQTNPSFCCPALVTEAMTARIRDLTDVPIVTLTYDGTCDRRNDAIVPYIQKARIRNREFSVPSS